MNKSRSSHGKSREVMDKLHTSWELAEALKDLKTTILGGWWVVGGWFNSVVRLRLSQPQAGDWAWAWAELGKNEKVREGPYQYTYRVFLGNCQNQYAYKRALKYKI